MMPPEVPRFIVAAVLATFIGVRGRRKKSLSPSGAVAGFFVGFVSFACSIRFGTTLLSFYLSATRATRYKASLKQKIEDGCTSATGNRSAKQVLASSLPAVLVSMAYFMLFRFDAPITPTLPWRSSLNLAYLLFFAACAGDTFASEIGIAMPGPGKLPVLILAPWRYVPRGTNGGITIEGTLASVVGGFVVGSASFLSGPEYSFSQLWLVAVGVLGGLIGSAIDSVLGMTVQTSWHDVEADKILQESPAKADEKYQHICGTNLLSGETVNALAAVLTGALAPLFLPLFQVQYSNV